MKAQARGDRDEKNSAFYYWSGFLCFFLYPAMAFICPTLIKEGRDLLATTKISQADQRKGKSLLDESEKFHESGKHGESIKKRARRWAFSQKSNVISCQLPRATRKNSASFR